MDEKLELNEFDILGVISLSDVQGIEKYVTPIMSCTEYGKKPTKFLSRSKEYYNVKTLTELSQEREKLKKLLTRQCTKRNFVILENMLNCSGKVYFKKFEELIKYPKIGEIEEQFEMARKCLIEDTCNITKILSKNSMIEVNPNLILPEGYINSEKRAIEMDNKAILYLFGKSLNLGKNKNEVQILTPGYGSIYIGPFLYALHGYDFTNILKSKYVEETLKIQDKYNSIRQLTSNQEIFDSNKKVVLLDDNIGTGNTMYEIKEDLCKEGIEECISGAVQYNWRNYYKVSIGKKLDIDRFNVNDFDILSPLNYAGHKLFKHAIDILHSSSEQYIKYLNSKEYRLSEFSDIKGALMRGVVCAKRTGLTLDENYDVFDKGFSEEELNLALQYKDSENRSIRPKAQEFIKELTQNIIEIDSKEPHNEIEK